MLSSLVESTCLLQLVYVSITNVYFEIDSLEWMLIRTNGGVRDFDGEGRRLSDDGSTANGPERTCND